MTPADTQRVLLLPGDGVGPEIVAAAAIPGAVR